MRHLPKPLSNRCQWQPQVHMSLKPTFVAADVCVVTTRLGLEARAWDLKLSSSDLLETNRLNWKVCLFSWVKDDPLIPNQLAIAGQDPDSFLKESSLASYLPFGTYVCTQALLWLRFGPPGVGTQQQTLKYSSFELILQAGVCCGPCNPSKWEARIWGWLEDGSPAALCVTLNQRPH